MKAIVLNEPVEFVKITKEMPVIENENDALVRVHKIGICGTDIHAYAGKQPFFSYPRIVGHELAVEVVAVGKQVHHVKVGDFCCVEPYRNPIIGQAVRRGKTNCGENLTVLGVHEDGGMQEFFTYPAGNLHPFNQLSTDRLALIEPLAIGRHAVNRAAIEKDDIVLVIGAGPIGLCVTEFVKLTGATVLVMDVNADRLQFCKAQLGIEHIVLAGDTPLEQLQEMLNGDLPTVVIDATGNKASMHNAFHLVAAGGTIVFVGLFIGDVTFYDPLFHKKEITLKATRAALSKDFTDIGKLMEQGILNPDWMITHRLAFDEVPTRFEAITHPSNQVVKAIIDVVF